MDVVGAAAGLVILSPLLLLLVLALWIVQGRPILYRQQRVGRKGKLFTLYKFRTMRPAPGRQITVGGDPRITPIGRWLRKTKLDELPQLWNILRGDMSIVGPRPEVPKYVDLNDPVWQRVLSVRPGLTDLASLVFIHEEEVLARFPDPEQAYKQIILPRKLKLNLRYVERQSLCLDLWLIFKTIRRLWAR